MREREFFAADRPVEKVSANGVELGVGDRVRLRRRRGGDILDLALAGRVARIDSIERDYEDRVYVAVVVEDDPGRDLGASRQIGHRFFFAPEEIEPLAAAERPGR